MNLLDIHRAEGLNGLRRLAHEAGTDATYLWQLATAWRGKKPSPDLAKRLIAADPRLTLDDLYADPSA
jgi:hypothetical protein